MSTVLPYSRTPLAGDQAIADAHLPNAVAALAAALGEVPPAPTFYVAPTSPAPTLGSTMLLQCALAGPGGAGTVPSHDYAVYHKNTPSFRVTFNAGEGLGDPPVPEDADPVADAAQADAFLATIAVALASAGTSYTHTCAGATPGALREILNAGRRFGWNTTLGPGSKVRFAR